jgi:uncharacterized protein YbjT (DUF2867 family)
MPESVLVVGSTGTQGGAVARRLIAEGTDVHALTRRPDSDPAVALAEEGATIVEGDLDDRSAVDDALADVDAAFLVTDYFEHGADTEVEEGTTFADAAAASGLDHVVFSSVACADADTGVRPFETKAEIERRLATAAVPTTIVRPTYFMQNFAAMRSRIADGTLALALEPHVPLQMVDVTDVGAVVAEALRSPGDYVGETVELAGDELTLEAMAVRFGRAIDGEVSAVSVPNEKIRESLGDDYADMFAWFNRSGFGVDLSAVRADHDVSLSTFDDYLQENGWWD